ncbi:MAG: EAL domain-containing protein [Eubacterium sp.]
MAYDLITGLPDMVEFKEIAQSIIKDSNDRYVVVTINVNNFRYINHVFGFEKGNVLLNNIAEFFCKNDSDCLVGCRSYADHFFLLIMEISDDFEKLQIVYENKIKDFSMKYSKDFPNAKLKLTFGGYHMKDNNVDISVACDKAELEREIKKGNYRINSLIYDISSQNDNTQDILHMFERAKTEGRVKVFLQPKIEVSSKTIKGAEALARIVDEDGKVIPPAVFIPVLEKTNIIGQLDLIVIEQVVYIISEWMKRGIIPVPISINLSKKDFRDDTLSKASEFVDKYEIPRNLIEFEVSENILLDRNDKIIDMLKYFKDDGYYFCIDEFGDRYTPISAASLFPADKIKFGRKFVSAKLKNEEGRKELARLIKNYENRGFVIICEGIETVEEEKQVRECGCKYIQGYLYDKPLPKEIFEMKYMLV